ncbi:unnamed protein product [Boreogadus saida]
MTTRDSWRTGVRQEPRGNQEVGPPDDPHCSQTLTQQHTRGGATPPFDQYRLVPPLHRRQRTPQTRTVVDGKQPNGGALYTGIGRSMSNGDVAVNTARRHARGPSGHEAPIEHRGLFNVMAEEEGETSEMDPTPVVGPRVNADVGFITRNSRPKVERKEYSTARRGPKLWVPAPMSLVNSVPPDKTRRLAPCARPEEAKQQVTAEKTTDKKA